MIKLIPGITGLGLALFAALGGCASVRSSTATDIDRPVETAWTVFADQDRLGEWLDGLGDLPWVSTGPEVGRVHRLTLGEDGETMVLEQCVTEIEPGRSFAFTLDHEWMHMENRFLFEPRADQGCTVRWEATIHPRQLWPSLLVHTHRGAIDGRYAEHLAKLRGLIEASAGDAHADP